MRWLLHLRPEAEQDLAKASEWYEAKRAGLGHEFLDSVALSLRNLALTPELQPLYYRSFRRILIARFPYKIFYQVIGDRIVIFRVMHAKQEHRRGLT